MNSEISNLPLKPTRILRAAYLVRQKIGETMAEVTCPTCHGRGGDVEVTCPNCSGTGYDPNEDNAFAQCHTCYGDGTVEADICPKCGGEGTIEDEEDEEDEE